MIFINNCVIIAHGKPDDNLAAVHYYRRTCTSAAFGFIHSDKTAFSCRSSRA